MEDKETGPPTFIALPIDTVKAARKLPTLEIVAYTGGFMNVPGWGPLCIDLTGLEAVDREGGCICAVSFEPTFPFSFRPDWSFSCPVLPSPMWANTPCPCSPPKSPVPTGRTASRRLPIGY